ncbi:hypothetical protein POJ06DRAFT_283620 [Lipomyces tetrasporus]|uniref:Uncharacterized protein n=1 Tax=Lipomyces tetrasporus TaxID=54092 RepID=A0AAD7QKM2_9ASCO|nr:uncharacterized protein POJ06DRAFT_283620 [Lipomyces tetrasporus]KAJ8096961.1 hypothetical protein POJ06DRAFT_283620 [Lipomyces tetrasporus]
MTRELGAALCDRLWRATKALKAATWDLEKLNVNEDDILAQIDSQKTYVTTRSRERLPSSVQQVRVVADNIEKLMIERNYELEQVHTRLRGHKNTQAVFSKIRRRRPAVEKEIRRYNALVDALPIAPELKPEKISYELLQKEMNGKEETSSLLHHFFKLDNFGMILSNVPRWVNSQGMRQAIQLHLQIQALHQEIAIIRAEVMRAIQWAMENLKALIAYARGNKSGRRFETIFVDKMWAGVQVAKSFLDNLDSMSNADFSMEEAKMQKPYLQELIERAYSCLPSESQGQNFDGELVVESDTVVSDQNFVDEEDEDCIPTDAIFDLAMLSVDDNQVDDQEAN